MDSTTIEATTVETTEAPAEATTETTKPETKKPEPKKAPAKKKPAAKKAAPKKAATKPAAKKPEAKPAGSKYTQASKTPDGLDLTKLLFDGLKESGVKATKALAPAGHYYRVVVGKTAIAYVNHREKGALKIEPKLEGNELPAEAKKAFAKAKVVRQGLGYVGTFSDEKSIAMAVVALSAAAAKADGPKETK